MGAKKTKKRLETALARILILEHTLAYYAKLPCILYVPEWRDYVGGKQAGDTLQMSAKMVQDDIDKYGIEPEIDE